MTTANKNASAPGTPPSDTEREELAAFEKLRAEAQRLLADAKDKVNAETFRNAIDQAGEKLRAAGGYSAEALRKAGAAVRKDLAAAAERLGPRWDALTDKTADLFSVWRDRSGVFLGQAAHAAGDWLRQWGGQMQHQIYKSGEMTAGGSFKCTACGEHLEIARPGHIPPCPKCQKTEFRRV